MVQAYSVKGGERERRRRGGTRQAFERRGREIETRLSLLCQTSATWFSLIRWPDPEIHILISRSFFKLHSLTRILKYSAGSGGKVMGQQSCFNTTRKKNIKLYLMCCSERTRERLFFSFSKANNSLSSGPMPRYYSVIPAEHYLTACSINIKCMFLFNATPLACLKCLRQRVSSQ